MLEDEAGDIIRKARRGQHLQLAAVAQHAGLSTQALEAIERLEHPPSAREAIALAAVLGLDGPKLVRIAAQLYEPQPRPEPHDQLIVKRLVVSQPDGWTSNCYLVGVTEGDEALIVDPGAESDRILAEIDRLSWRPRYIALTHGHYDHVGGLSGILAEWGVSVLVGRGDLPMFDVVPEHAHLVAEGEAFQLNRHQLVARSTPGHTAGGVSYLLNDCCFVGDALFAGSIGNANVPVDGYQQLRTSLWTKVLSLDPSVILYPGHGPITTVGEELAANPFFPPTLTARS